MSRWPRWWGSIIGNYAERLADLHCLIRHLLLQDLGSQIVFDRAASRRRAEELVNLGMGAADAAHVALAEQAGCDFVTCDDRLLRQCRRIGIAIWFGTPTAYCDKEDLE